MASGPKQGSERHGTITEAKSQNDIHSMLPMEGMQSDTAAGRVCSRHAGIIQAAGQLCSEDWMTGWRTAHPLLAATSILRLPPSFMPSRPSLTASGTCAHHP